jgi:hypothetical protein
MKIVLLILSGLILISLASATTTQITVLTIPDAEVTINVLNLDYDALQSFIVNASSSGQATATSTVDLSSIIISVVIRNYGSIIKGPKKFEGYSSGSPIVLDMTDSTPATTPPITVLATAPLDTTPPAANTTPPATPATTPPAAQNTTNTSSSSSAFSYLSSVGSGIKNNYIYIIIVIGIIVIIIVIIFIIKKSWGKIQLGKDPEEKEIIETEKKVKYLQKEVEIMRNRKSRLEEVNKKFKDLQKELKVLKIDDKL